MVEARQVNDQEIFTELLEEKFKNYEFLNAGVSGYGTIQQLLLYDRLSKEIDFDYIILMYTKLNDWLDISKEYQIFLENDNIASRPFFKEDLFTIEYPKNFIQQSKFKELAKKIKIVNLFYNSYKNIKTMLKNNRIEKKIINKDFKIFNNKDELFIKSWKKNIEIIRKLNNLIIQNGSRLIVFGIPIEPIDLNNNNNADDEFDVDLYSNSKDYNYHYHSLNKCFKNFLINNKIVNLHFKNDAHWSSIGHIAASDCIYDYLNTKKLL